jgi:hypothetical protein
MINGKLELTVFPRRLISKLGFSFLLHLRNSVNTENSELFLKHSWTLHAILCIANKLRSETFLSKVSNDKNAEVSNKILLLRTVEVYYFRQRYNCLTNKNVNYFMHFCLHL